MKLRKGFVSNSSAASFVVDKRKMSKEQLDMFRWFLNWQDEELLTYNQWEIEEDDVIMKGWTSMDNLGIQSVFNALHMYDINKTHDAVIDYNGDA